MGSDRTIRNPKGCPISTVLFGCDERGTGIRNDNRSTEADRQYTAAYAAHYEKLDLREALGIYKSLIAAHQGTRAAAYSRSQIQNIVNSIVPEQKLFDVLVDLALAHLHEHEDRPDAKGASRHSSKGC